MYANPAIQQLYQLSAEDFVGKNIYDLVNKGIFNISAAQKIFETKKPVSIMQKISSGKTCLTMGVPIFQDNGEIKMIVINSHDVTELYMLKEKLLQSQKLAEGYQAQLTDMRITQLMKEDIIVRSKKMLDILDLHDLRSRYYCITLGELGPIKKLWSASRANLKRSDNAFITINCGAAL